MEMATFICDICCTEFKFKFEIILRLKKHRSVNKINKNEKAKETLFKCDVCQKQFTRKESLTNHNLLHSGKSPHTCSVCGKSFTRRYILDEHEKKHFGLSKASQSTSLRANLTCNYCKKKFTRTTYLKAHIAIHTKESQHKCEHCNKQFTRKEYLANHTRTHTGVYPYKCELCSKQFVSQASLKVHSTTQCQSNFVCDVCSRSFAGKSSLTNHKNRAHCENGKFKCIECGKCFAVQQNLVMHIMSHKI